MAGWFATDAFVQQNPSTIKRFTTALLQSAQWANSHQRESAVIMAHYTGTSPEVAATMTRAHYDTPETTVWPHSTYIPIMLTQISAVRFQRQCSGGSQPWPPQQVCRRNG